MKRSCFLDDCLDDGEHLSSDGCLDDADEEHLFSDDCLDNGDAEHLSSDDDGLHNGLLTAVWKMLMKSAHFQMTA